MRQMSRRKLLGKGAQALVAGGIAFSQIPGLEARAASKRSKSEAAVDYYQKLGVTTFINAAGTYTALSASTMPEQVQAAIALAAKQPVNLNELIEASGAYLAKQLRCESALVTAVLPPRWLSAQRLASPWEMSNRFSPFPQIWVVLKTK